MKKKLIVTACVVVLIAALVPFASATGKGETPAAAKTIITVTNWTGTQSGSGRTQINQMDTGIGKMLAEKTGVAVNNYYITGDAETAFNLKLASKTWEDIITSGINNSWIQKLLESGVIVPVDPYLNDKAKYPNLAALSPEVRKTHTYSDGKIYYFPSGWFEDLKTMDPLWNAMGWYVNPDYLKAVNMTVADLATLGGVEKFLQAVANAKLTTANGQKVIPMASSQDFGFYRTILTTFGVSVGSTFPNTSVEGFDIVDGKLLNFRQDPRTKQAYAWMNRLYRLGVMDPEISTVTNDSLVEKLMNKRVALVADAAWAWWGSVTGGPSPVTDLTYAAFPKVPGVTKLGVSRTVNPYGGGGWILTKASANKDAIARLADYYSAKGQFRYWESLYGTRGVLWDWSPTRGKPYFVVTDPRFKAAIQAGEPKSLEEWGYQSVASVTDIDLDPNFYNDDQQNSLQWIFKMQTFNTRQGYWSVTRPVDQVIVPGEGTWAQTAATILDLDKQYTAKLITAKDDDSFNATWNEYQDKLTTVGKFPAVIAEFQAAYQAMQR